jgi:hypothetical protein
MGLIRAFLAGIIPCVWGTTSREGLEIDWRSIVKMNDGYLLRIMHAYLILIPSLSF